MAVTGKKVGRGDIRLVRGDTQRVGARWRHRTVETGLVTPVDLSAWAGVLELRSPDGSDLWYTAACQTMTTDGYATCDIPASALTDPVWNLRRSGQWKIHVTNPTTGERKTLAWGYYTISD